MRRTRKRAPGQLHLFFDVATGRVGVPAAEQLALFGPGELWAVTLSETTARVDKVLTGDAAEGLGERWADTLRRLYPAPHTAKKIEKALDAKAATVKAWLAGQTPQAGWLCRLTALHGGPIGLYLLGQERLDGGERAALSAQFDALQQALAALSVAAGAA